MIPVFQTLTTLNDGRGNCFVACLASIMERPLRELPRLANDVPVGAFWQTLEDWLIGQGLFLNRHEVTPSGWAICGGALGQLPHVVVVFNGQLVHDPHPLRAEFVTTNEWWTVDPISDAQRPYCDERLKIRSEPGPIGLADAGARTATIMGHGD